MSSGIDFGRNRPFPSSVSCHLSILSLVLCRFCLLVLVLDFEFRLFVPRAEVVRTVLVRDTVRRVRAGCLYLYNARGFFVIIDEIHGQVKYNLPVHF